MHSNVPLGLLDVVCGEPADVGSVHRYVHAGALFCFCSDVCLARFIIDPHQFLPAERSAPPAEPALTTRSVPPARPAVVAHATLAPPAALVPTAPDASAAASGPLAPTASCASENPTPGAVPNAPTASATPGSTRPAPVAGPTPISPVAAATAAPRSPQSAHLVEPSAVAPAPVPALEPIAPVRGSSNVLASLFAWREKRFAARTCTELLKLHKIVSARHPQLAGPALYRQVVAAHNGGDLAFADAVLENAEQSFTIWPVQRALKFADVVHYLAATEFLASAGRTRWIHADMKRIVAARVPHDL